MVDFFFFPPLFIAESGVCAKIRDGYQVIAVELYYFCEVTLLPVASKVQGTKLLLCVCVVGMVSRASTCNEPRWRGRTLMLPARDVTWPTKSGKRLRVYAGAIIWVVPIRTFQICKSHNYAPSLKLKVYDSLTACRRSV
jgi:hypothetical protein